MGFAKLYREGRGQVLVMLDAGANGPEVRFFFTPEGLGVCSVAVEFSGDDEVVVDESVAWDRAVAMFHDMDEATAVAMAQEQGESILAMLAEREPPKIQLLQGGGLIRP